MAFLATIITLVRGVPVKASITSAAVNLGTFVGGGLAGIRRVSVYVNPSLLQSTLDQVLDLAVGILFVANGLCKFFSPLVPLSLD